MAHTLPLGLDLYICVSKLLLAHLTITIRFRNNARVSRCPCSYRVLVLLSSYASTIGDQKPPESDLHCGDSQLCSSRKSNMDVVYTIMYFPTRSASRNTVPSAALRSGKTLIPCFSPASSELKFTLFTLQLLASAWYGIRMSRFILTAGQLYWHGDVWRR